ncbi:MAG: hypothetical protein EBY28_27345, partial [Betaproteobacteria bacterium]|nr:hypothetical protein [Betaproteobacteria bacterium]
MPYGDANDELPSWRRAAGALPTGPAHRRLPEFASGWQLKNALRITHYGKFYQNVYPGGAVGATGNMTLAAYNNANRRTNTRFLRGRVDDMAIRREYRF